MVNQLSINQRTVGDAHPAYLIAEVGMSHEGSLGLAMAYVTALSKTGVDAVKFQTHIAEAESTHRERFRVPVFPQDKTRYDYWNRTAFTQPEWLKLAKHTRDCGLDFLSSPFSEQAVDWLYQCDVPAWKIASGEVNNRPLLEKVLETGLPILLSSGMSSWDELTQAVELIKLNGVGFAVLQCTTAYPCPPDEWGLNAIAEIKDNFLCPAGLSDHSGSIVPSIAAVTLGAKILEFHVTFSKAMFGPDVSSSLLIDQVSELSHGVRQLEKALASPIDKGDQANSKTPLRLLFNKSIVAAIPLLAGTILSRDHLAFKKPGDGMPTCRFNEVLGKRLSRNLEADDLILESDLETI